jgi:hypothetical protein
MGKDSEPSGRAAETNRLRDLSPKEVGDLNNFFRSKEPSRKIKEIVALTLIGYYVKLVSQPSGTPIERKSTK